MDLDKLQAGEIRSWEPEKVRETEGELRHELAKLRMDIYTSKAQNSGKMRGLRRSLARTMTVLNERKRQAARAAAQA